MSIEQAEKLKRELTDKWVVVADGVPELRRFTTLTGQIKTVNMNCRALVEFDGPEDISWYDIDPQFLTVVEGPRPKAKVEAKVSPAAAAKVAPAAKPATGGGSPLDKIRGGAGGAAAKPAGGSPLDKIRGSAAPKSGGSPLDKIRAAGAVKADAPPAEEAPPAEAPPAEAPPAEAPIAEAPIAEAPIAEAPIAEQPAAKKPAATGSPLDQIRAGGGFKG